MGINWTDLFPTKLSVAIFIGYMSLFVSQGILVTKSQDANNSYSYNTVTVVLFTDVLKLTVSIILYSRENSLKHLLKEIIINLNVMRLYFVPAFLYCLYNNLSFINLSTFDPTTYYLLLQLRVVITGILFQIIFKKYLSTQQWISLIILTVGCMLKQVQFGTDTTADNNAIEATNTPPHINKNMVGLDFSINAVFIIAQTVCSCLAGVYNEYLLKDKGSDVNIFVQNVFMHTDSILCNSVILLVQGGLTDAFTPNNLYSIFRFNVIIIIVNNTAIGIVTSFFLKYMNSILKTFASALELVFTAILCYILFSIPIYLNTIISIAVVSFAIYLYSQSPVVNLGKIKMRTGNNSSDTRRLLLEAYKVEETV